MISLEQTFGQDTCMNCGWDKGHEKPIEEVKFVDGDAVCPECGELCEYFDYRDLTIDHQIASSESTPTQEDQPTMSKIDRDQAVRTFESSVTTQRLKRTFDEVIGVMVRPEMSGLIEYIKRKSFEVERQRAMNRGEAFCSYEDFEI